MSPHEYNPLRLIQALSEEATMLSRARQEDFRRGWSALRHEAGKSESVGAGRTCAEKYIFIEKKKKKK